MKRMKQVIALLGCAVLLLTGAPARAEGPDAAERGLEALREAINWKVLVLPQEESYLEEWKTLYPRKAWHAPNLTVELVPQPNSWPEHPPYVFEGMPVTVVAEENDMSCMLYRTPDFELCAGWIPSIRLLEDFPGERYTLGEEREGDFTLQKEAALRWSRKYFPRSVRIYTELEETLRGCVGFTFEYQVTAENTPDAHGIFGPRTLYVYDGNEWIEAGSFPYPALGTVLVQVWLEEPTDIAAIATIADCMLPDVFGFRQTARDFLLQTEGQGGIGDG